MKNKFDNIPDEIKRKCIEEVITRVEEIDSDQVGVIVAQEIIDIVTERLGPEIYNHALRDAKKLIQERLADLDYEIDTLEQTSLR